MNTELQSTRFLAPFSSWQNRKPPEGYFTFPIGEAGQAFYQRKGFLVLDRLFGDEDIVRMRAEALRICRNETGAIMGIHAALPEESDEAVMQRILCIHMAHKISPLFQDMLAQLNIVQTLTALIGPDVKAMQSMVFLKGAGQPGQAWHQDEDFIPTRDRSLAGAWIALDDATVENGCLWVIPGSHQSGILWNLEWHGDRRFDCELESRGFPYSDSDAIPVEVKKGSVVFFNGYLLHRSLPNRTTSGFRRVLVNHYMSASSLLPLRKEEGKSVALSDYRDIVMVAGTDPYAWKGIENLVRPHVRPNGGGGCMKGTDGDQYRYEDETKQRGANGL